MEYTNSNEWLSYEKLLKERPELFKQSSALEIITDPKQVNSYYEETKRRLGVVYSSKWNTMLVDLVRNSEGIIFAYERVVPTSSGSAIVIIPRYKNKYLLLKQFRHAIRTEQYAFPRSFGEDGLSGEENAKKELTEEINATIKEDSLVFLGKTVSDSGLCGNVVSIYQCEFEAYKLVEGYEEILEIIELTEEEMEEWIHSGKINDGFTLSAYALWKSRYVG